MKKIIILSLIMIFVIGCAQKNTESPTLGYPAPGFEDVPEMVVGDGSTADATITDDPAVSGPADESVDGIVADESDVDSPVEIAIAGFEFEPSPITVAKGTTVVWVNRDSAPHNVISTDGKELSSKTLSLGDIYEFTFEEAGTYEYFCSIHPSMKGTVIVE